MSAGPAQPLERLHERFIACPPVRVVLALRHQQPYTPHLHGLLRARCVRPRHRSATKQRDELTPSIAPGVTRVAVLRDAAQTAGTGQWGAIQTVAPSFGVEVSPINVRDAPEIERAVAAFARSASGGLIVTASGLTFVHRDLIVTLAARHRLPAVYWDRTPVTGGGLISYGADLLDQYRRAAGYVDRILKGEKPGDLPVIQPSKFELVINLRTAKALGLTVPPTLLARADEVIE